MSTESNSSQSAAADKERLKKLRSQEECDNGASQPSPTAPMRSSNVPTKSTMNVTREERSAAVTIEPSLFKADARGTRAEQKQVGAISIAGNDVAKPPIFGAIALAPAFHEVKSSPMPMERQFADVHTGSASIKDGAEERFQPGIVSITTLNQGDADASSKARAAYHSHEQVNSVGSSSSKDGASTTKARGSVGAGARAQRRSTEKTMEHINRPVQTYSATSSSKATHVSMANDAKLSRPLKLPTDDLDHVLVDPIVSNTDLTSPADRDIRVTSTEEHFVTDESPIVAIVVEDEEKEKIYAQAVHYIPDSEPATNQNRRRVYGIFGIIFLLIGGLGGLLGYLLNSGDDPNGNDLPRGNDLPTGKQPSDRDVRNVVYRNYLAQFVGDKVHTPNTPHYSAANWIINEDPRQLDRKHPNFLQRYILAFFFFHTSRNRNTRWRWCEPPSEEETDDCTATQTTAATNENEKERGEEFFERNIPFRWLSGQSECIWLGVTCMDGLTVTQLLLGT